MSVPVEELEGGPTFSITRTQTSSVRPVKVAWADVPEFMQELYPLGYEGAMPGFPFLRVAKVDIAPFDPACPDPAAPLPYNLSLPNTYSKGGARITINYESPKWDQQQQSGPGGDHSGPGGQAGSTAGTNQVFITHKVTIGGEFLTYPSQGAVWGNTAVAPWVNSGTLGAAVLAGDTSIVMSSAGQQVYMQPGNGILIGTEEMIVTGSVIQPDGTLRVNVQRGTGGTTAAAHALGDNTQYVASSDRLDSVGENIKLGAIIPTLEHNVTWHHVLWPPWGAIRQAVGKVNQAVVLGAAPGCLLFLGAEASRDIGGTQIPFWSLSYKFTEKCLNFDVWNQLTDPGAVTFGAIAQGWNYFLKPSGKDAGTFVKVTLKGGGTIYKYTSMSGLFIPGAAIP